MVLFASCFIAWILLIWFKTDAFVEYSILFGLGNQVKASEYANKKITEEYPLTYPRFLRMRYDTFAIKLITCPICLSVWLSIIIGLFVLSFIIIPVICIFSLILYGVTCKVLGIQ
jgi:hypothetical protein